MGLDGPGEVVQMMVSAGLRGICHGSISAKIHPLDAGGEVSSILSHLDGASEPHGATWSYRELQGATGQFCRLRVTLGVSPTTESLTAQADLPQVPSMTVGWGGVIWTSAGVKPPPELPDISLPTSPSLSHSTLTHSHSLYLKPEMLSAAALLGTQQASFLFR